MTKYLSLVGSGIKIISHLTRETESHIKKADIVLYLVNEPLMEEWIQANARKSENLSALYFSQDNRLDSYHMITKKIISTLDFYEFVSVVFYGHPTVFTKPGLEAIKQARADGIETKILPGISAEDCLFADLGIDPCDTGCYSLEATDLLVYQRRPDPASHLIIWQVGMSGNAGHQALDKTAIVLLCEYLLQFYSPNHQISLYEASLYPGMDCSINTFALEELPEQDISKIATLYIPPEKTMPVNVDTLKKLGFFLK